MLVSSLRGATEQYQCDFPSTHDITGGGASVLRLLLHRDHDSVPGFCRPAWISFCAGMGRA